MLISDVMALAWKSNGTKGNGLKSYLIPPAALSFSIHVSAILVAIQVFPPEPACFRKPQQSCLHAMIAIIH